MTRVRVDDAVYRAAVPAEDLPALVGRQLAEPVHARQLLARAQVSARPPLGARPDGPHRPGGPDEPRWAGASGRETACGCT